MVYCKDQLSGFTDDGILSPHVNRKGAEWVTRTKTWYSKKSQNYIS